MVTIDTIKFKTPSEYIKKVREGIRNLPFQCRYKVLDNGYTEIEFSAKILCGDYSRLISQDTIGQALNNFSAFMGCDLDIDSILVNSYVNRVDFTTDIPINNLRRWGIENFRDLKRLVCFSISDYEQWSFGSYRGHGGVKIMNTVNSQSARKSLTIYDKEYETSLSKNRNFLNFCGNDSDSIKEYFRGKVRFEYRVTSLSAIRSITGENCSLQALLSINSNPLRNIMLLMFRTVLGTEERTVGILKPRDRERISVMKTCDFDPTRIEEFVREHYGKNHKRTLKRYMELLAIKEYHQLESVNVAYFV